MTGVNFKEANLTLLKPQSMTDEECGSLRVFTDGTQVVSCWKLSWRDRIKTLLFGTIWLGVLGGRTQPPVWMVCERTVFKKGE